MLNLFIVQDSDKDDRFSDNPLVTGEPRVKRYAGAPLVVPNGHAVWTLCVIDHQPRKLTPVQKEAFVAPSRWVIGQLELRKQNLAFLDRFPELQRLTLRVESSLQGLLIFQAEKTSAT